MVLVYLLSQFADFKWILNCYDLTSIIKNFSLRYVGTFSPADDK